MDYKKWPSRLWTDWIDWRSNRPSPPPPMIHSHKPDYFYIVSSVLWVSQTHFSREWQSIQWNFTVLPTDYRHVSRYVAVTFVSIVTWDGVGQHVTVAQAFRVTSALVSGLYYHAVGCKCVSLKKANKEASSDWMAEPADTGTDFVFSNVLNYLFLSPATSRFTTLPLYPP